MAKYERELRGDFDYVLQQIDTGILQASFSATFEDGSDFLYGSARCAVRVYERYSAFGGNRVSLNITLFGQGSELSLSAITSGGTSALLYKIGTLGESTFLNTLIDIVEHLGES